MPLFSKTAKDYLESGNNHLEQACDIKHDLTIEQSTKELQKAIDDYLKALEWVSEKEKYGEPYLEQRRNSYSPLNYYYNDGRQYSAREYLLIKMAWTYLLDGQYDKSLAYLDTWWGQGYPGTESWKEERDLIRARICALKGNYEQSLTLYSEVVNRTYYRNAEIRSTYANIGCDAEREKEALKNKLGGDPIYRSSHSRWFPYPSNIETLYWSDFAERIQKENPEILFPSGRRPQRDDINRIFFVILITLKDLNVFPPILRLRKSAVIANDILETAQHYHMKHYLDYMKGLPHQGEPSAIPLPFSEGLLLTWLTKFEQISRFLKEMQTRIDIERLDCYYLSQN
jgi:hypothetical protein